MGNAPWTGNTAGGLVQYTGGAHSSENATYPTDPFPFNTPIPYAAGSFLFQAPATVLSSPASGSNVVTIDATGYDLSEHNDFAIQALASVSGTITAPASAGASSTPANGVVVHLSSAGAVVGSRRRTQAAATHSATSRPALIPSARSCRRGSCRRPPPRPTSYWRTPPTGANVFQLPSGYQAVNTVVDDFNANGKPDIAVLGWNSGASIAANTPIVFVYYDGATTTPLASTRTSPWDRVTFPRRWSMATPTDRPSVSRSFSARARSSRLTRREGRSSNRAVSSPTCR